MSDRKPLDMQSPPTFNPAPGTYATAQRVTLSDTAPGATIYYTTNGSTPTTSSTQFTSAITVSATTTIKAITAAAGCLSSTVATGTYTIETPAGPQSAPNVQPSFEDTNATGSADHVEGAETPKTKTLTVAPIDPFDPINLGISTDYAAAINLAASAKPFEFRKPNDQEYFRVSTRKDHCLHVGAILDKQDMSRVYVIAPRLLPDVKREFPKHLRTFDLFVAQTLLGTSLVWPVPLAEDRGGKWNSTQRTACHDGKSRWTNIASGRGQYDIHTIDNPKEIDWDILPPFSTILREAVSERLIDSLEHTLLRKLRGQVE